MTNIKLLINRILSRFATPLPVGVTQFNAWADSIIALSGQFADRDSMLFALASMLIHADAKHGFLPKHYFVVRLRKVAANQIASQVFQDIKAKQEAANKAAQEKEAKKQAEVTAATQTATSDGQAPQ